MAQSPLQSAPQQQFDISKQKVENPLNLTPQYANFSYAVATDWDIRVVFMEIIPQAPSGIQIELRGNIVMTPAQAKALVTALQTTISQYEARQGTIQWPPKSPNPQLH